MQTQKLKKKFTAIKKKRLNIQNKFKQLKSKLDQIDLIYETYVNANNNSDNQIGFDSLQFQNKLYDFEFENLDKLYTLIDNKIYGEYYVLLNTIIKDTKKNIVDVPIENITNLINKYPITKNRTTKNMILEY